MQFRLLDAVQEVVQVTETGVPADKALRQYFEFTRNLPQETRGEVSHGVFNYFRWRGWFLDAPLHKAIRATTELAARFAQTPQSFTDAELMANWAPAWVADELPVTADLVRAFQRNPEPWLRARPGRRDELAAQLGVSVPSTCPLPDALPYTGREDLFKHPLFHEGAFEIQDPSSQAVGIMCAPAARETWWDACAGEGGKTVHLGDLKQNKGLIWASDTAQWRLDKLKRRAGRAGIFNYRAALWKGDAALPTKTKFDGLLVDAPCSGVGTWGRNPHARWTMTREDVAELADLQLRLLKNACRSLKPGGRLIYSVCTLTRSEGHGVVGRFNETEPHFKPLDLTDPWTGEARPRHELQPQITGGNGMFVSGWKRDSEVESAPNSPA